MRTISRPVPARSLRRNQVRRSGIPFPSGANAGPAAPPCWRESDRRGRFRARPAGAGPRAGARAGQAARGRFSRPLPRPSRPGMPRAGPPNRRRPAGGGPPARCGARLIPAGPRGARSPPPRSRRASPARRPPAGGGRSPDQCRATAASPGRGRPPRSPRAPPPRRRRRRGARDARGAPSSPRCT